MLYSWFSHRTDSVDSSQRNCDTKESDCDLFELGRYLGLYEKVLSEVSGRGCLLLVGSSDTLAVKASDLSRGGSVWNSRYKAETKS